MRLGCVVLVAAVALFASSSASQEAAETKKSFAIPSPDSNDTLEGVFIKDDDKTLYDDDDREGDSKDDADSDDEERAISGGTVDKLAKVVGTKMESLVNNFLWVLTRPLRQKKVLTPPKSSHPVNHHPLRVDSDGFVQPR